MKKPTQANRRSFMKGIGMLSGAAFTASTLPLSSAVMAKSVAGNKKSKTSSDYAYHPDIVDPALENFPGYSTHIPSGRAHLLADAGHNMLDTQFLV